MGQDIVGCQDVAVLYIWYEYGCRVFGIFYIKFQTLRHDTFCDVVENLTTHASS